LPKKKESLQQILSIKFRIKDILIALVRVPFFSTLFCGKFLLDEETDAYMRGHTPLLAGCPTIKFWGKKVTKRRHLRPLN
jgi:hypothetical protein